MAYGVKFRLVFSDVKGNLRRVEILQKDYSGEVFPLIGQANPVVIKWEGDDDFYTPIIGSTCELNLFETADTVYDPFYRASEREYKVRISTGLDQDKVWNTEVDQWEQANYFWEEENSFEIYWEGWLQTDQYQESLQPYPNPIKLVAYDGLGTLDAYDAPYSNAADGGYDSNEDSMFFYFYYILNNIQLDLDIYVANTIRKSDGATNETLYHDIILNEYGVFDNLDFRNAKELLESFLRATNSRVFQSQGRWYIVSNSNLIDTNISQLFNFNIGLSIKNQLIDTGEEIIEYKVFDRLGNYKFTTEENILLKAPTDLKPIGADLYKEYLKPNGSVRYEVKLPSERIINPNPQLLYSNYGWTLQNFTEIVNDADVALVGNNVIRSAGHSINVSYPNVIIKNDINTVVTDETKAIKIGFSFFVEPYSDAVNLSDQFEYFFKVLVRGVNAVGDEIYYNFKDEAWETSNATQVQDLNKKLIFKKISSWQEAEFELKPKGGVEGDLKIEINIRQISFTTYPDPSVSQIKYTYIDKLFISEINETANELVGTNTQEVNKTRTAEYDMGDILVSNYLGVDGFQNGYGGFFKRPRDFTIFASDYYSLDRIITQEILNDTRDFVPRYEGTFYNLIDEPIPVSLHNKVWINFGSGSFTEQASCYIDSMTYSVKSNEYEMTMHVPNQGNDVTSKFKVKLKK